MAYSGYLGSKHHEYGPSQSATSDSFLTRTIVTSIEVDPVEIIFSPINIFIGVLRLTSD